MLAIIAVTPQIMANRVLPSPPYQLARASVATAGPTDSIRIIKYVDIASSTAGEKPKAATACGTTGIDATLNTAATPAKTSPYQA
jgi:hypothetical protein